MRHTNFVAWSAGIAIALFIAMLICLELGRQYAMHQVRRNGPAARTGVGVVDGTVHGLLALLLGFVFAGAAGRFDGRRQHIAEEVSAIGTAWQRIDVLPPEAQPVIRAGFRHYVDALVATYTTPLPGDPYSASAEVIRAEKEIWARSVAACMTQEGEKARMLLLPAVNEMFDAVERERLARRMHPPRVIFLMLAMGALAASLFGGYGLSAAPTRNWMYILGVSATTSVAVYVILELEYPRYGLVQVDAIDLEELRASMN